MLSKRFLFIVLSAVLSFSQSDVAVSGTVKDGRTKSPIAGAGVRLKGLNLGVFTDANGAFTLNSTSIFFPGSNRKGRAPVVGVEALLSLQKNYGSVGIHVFDLCGNRRFFSVKEISREIVHPRLSPGIYLCKLETPELEATVRFLAPLSATDIEALTKSIRKTTGVSPKRLSAASGTNASSRAVDTLLVEKNGYRSASIPLDSYTQTGLSVFLDDTSVSSYDDATILPDPSWPCFMPEGIPPPKLGEAVFNITLKYSAIHNVGVTKFGRRRQFDIGGGSVNGSNITATVLSGGLDYELTLSTGSMEIEQIVILKAGNTPILMRNAGVAPAGTKIARMVLDFEAPNSSQYSWLNTGKYAAERIIDSAGSTIKLDVYDISKAALPQKRIQIKDPANVPNQTWDCLKQSGSQGATVFTENVTLGGSISIGASKRGNRNIIPITGGTTSGRVTGKILSGGADYQLGGLDARYTLAPNDGEFIIVRNCGSGTLFPVFEARVDGPYNFLNENKYISSQPGMGSGGVTITFYEKR